VTRTGEPSEISNVAWDAVLKKDRRYDGKFVYAAVTTNIYCRPSCPARNPQRRNALIFLTAEEAERQGYVACLRCHPNSLTPAEECIKAALDYIETHLDQAITLTTLSQVTGFSPHHFQESFKRIVGLSPKAFCDARRIARFKQYLRAGQSISSACYEVGYGSSRALYEKTKKGLGMTPAAYRHGGKGIRVCYAITDSALGSVLVAGAERGICAVLLGEDEAILLRELRQEFPSAVFKQESSDEWQAVVLSCQGEDPLFSKLPASLRGRVLQARVWDALQ
jgi:AraC family transcriptional regulator, regulatory protein of adaptative response / methylated-DNA-[protein]-cysteine methyltransferase